nr:SNF1-related protein kinase catalytic subunit alpha KIN10-like [Arachis hypogaea]
MDAGFNRNHSSEVSSPVAGHFPGYMDYQVGMRPQIPVERKWALGIQVEERGVPVEELLEADEVFCTGTVVVINPVFSVTYWDCDTDFWWHVSMNFRIMIYFSV